MTPFLSNIRGNIGGILDAILGSAIPANAIQIGGSDGTDLRAISTDNSGRVALAIGSKATYRCATSFAPAASVSSQPNFVIKGSASKVVKITKIRFSMYAGTGSSTPSSIRLQRYNSVSGGIGSTVNPAQNDPNDASPTAVVTSYTSNPTIGIRAGVGQSDIFDYQLTTVSATTAPAPPPVELLFGELNSTEPLVLRGASDFLGIAITQVGTSPIASIMIEWTEE
jgi:hypothetical protein